MPLDFYFSVVRASVLKMTLKINCQIMESYTASKISKQKLYTSLIVHARRKKKSTSAKDIVQLKGPPSLFLTVGPGPTATVVHKMVNTRSDMEPNL